MNKEELIKKTILPDDIKIIVEAVKHGSIGEINTFQFKNVTDLPVTKWDGYHLTSIRILCDLTAIKDANHLIGFLQYHQYCLGMGADLKDVKY